MKVNPRVLIFILAVVFLILCFCGKTIEGACNIQYNQNELTVSYQGTIINANADLNEAGALDITCNDRDGYARRYLGGSYSCNPNLNNDILIPYSEQNDRTCSTISTTCEIRDEDIPENGSLRLNGRDGEQVDSGFLLSSNETVDVVCNNDYYVDGNLGDNNYNRVRATCTASDDTNTGGSLNWGEKVDNINNICQTGCVIPDNVGNKYDFLYYPDDTNTIYEPGSVVDIGDSVKLRCNTINSEGVPYSQTEQCDLYDSNSQRGAPYTLIHDNPESRCDSNANYNNNCITPDNQGVGGYLVDNDGNRVDPISYIADGTRINVACNTGYELSGPSDISYLCVEGRDLSIGSNLCVLSTETENVDPSPPDTPTPEETPTPAETPTPEEIPPFTATSDRPTSECNMNYTQGGGWDNRYNMYSTEYPDAFPNGTFNYDDCVSNAREWINDEEPEDVCTNQVKDIVNNTIVNGTDNLNGVDDVAGLLRDCNVSYNVINGEISPILSMGYSN